MNKFETDTLAIAAQCDMTVVPSKSEGYWHTAWISTGRTLHAFGDKSEAIESLWDYDAFRQHVIKKLVVRQKGIQNVKTRR